MHYWVDWRCISISNPNFCAKCIDFVILPFLMDIRCFHRVCIGLLGQIATRIVISGRDDNFNTRIKSINRLHLLYIHEYQLARSTTKNDVNSKSVIYSFSTWYEIEHRRNKHFSISSFNLTGINLLFLCMCLCVQKLTTVIVFID